MAAIGLSIGGMSGLASASPPTPRRVVKQYIADINRARWTAARALLDSREHRLLGSLDNFASGLSGSSDRVTFLGPGHITGRKAEVSLRMIATQDDVVHRFNLMYTLVDTGHRWLIDNVSEVRPAVLVSSPPTSPPTIATTTLPPQTAQTVQTPWGTLQVPYSPVPCTLENPDDWDAAAVQASQKELGRNPTPEEVTQGLEQYWQEQIAACEAQAGYPANEPSTQPPTSP